MPASRFPAVTWLVALSALVAAPVLAEDQPAAQAPDQQTAASQPQAPDAGEPAAEPEQPPMSSAEIAFWSLTGVTGVTLITGSIFGLTALAEEQRFEHNPSDQARDRGEARAVAADVLFGVSAAAAIAAAIVLLVADDEPTAEPVADRPVLEPTVAVGGAGITLQF